MGDDFQEEFTEEEFGEAFGTAEAEPEVAPEVPADPTAGLTPEQIIAHVMKNPELAATLAKLAPAQAAPAQPQAMDPESFLPEELRGMNLDEVIAPDHQKGIRRMILESLNQFQQELEPYRKSIQQVEIQRVRDEWGALQEQYPDAKGLTDKVSALMEANPSLTLKQALFAAAEGNLTPKGTKAAPGAAGLGFGGAAPRNGQVQKPASAKPTLKQILSGRGL